MLQKMILFSAFLALSSCISRPMGPPLELLKKKAMKLAFDDLERRFPEGRKFYAGVGATEFVNGAPMRLVEREILYDVDRRIDHWKGRVHLVYARIKFKSGRKTDTLKVKYTIKEMGPRTDKLRFGFIYGLPTQDYYHFEDPFKNFRKNRRLLKALKKRDVYVGMPEKALFLSWGQPQGKTTRTSLEGEERVYNYGRQSIYIMNGMVVRKKRD